MDDRTASTASRSPPNAMGRSHRPTDTGEVRVVDQNERDEGAEFSLHTYVCNGALLADGDGVSWPPSRFLLIVHRDPVSSSVIV